MAFASDSTTAPARLLLPPVPFVFRPSPPIDDTHTADDLLREIAEEIDRQLGADRPELPPEPLPAAGRARAIHLRRQLEAAAEQGASLLSALDLPQLDALHHAIATLDAMDGDMDLEGVNEDGDELDAGEHDTSDVEPSLGWLDDFTARLDPLLATDPEAERDDADLEDDDRDDAPEPLAWALALRKAVVETGATRG